MWDFSYPFHNVFDKKLRIFYLQSKFLVPPLFLLRYSIVTPSIVHRNDGAAMEQRWTSDGAVAKEKRNQSGGKAASNPTFLTLENKFYMT